MLLVELDKGGTLERISNQAINNFTHQWERQIIEMDTIDFGIRSGVRWGGYYGPNLGSMSLSPELFVPDLPLEDMTAVLKWTDTTEEEAVEIIGLNLHLSTFSRNAALYDLYKVGYDIILPDGFTVPGSSGATSALFNSSVQSNDTLDSFFAWACQPSRLNLTYNNSLIRSPSPEIDFTVEGEQLLIDILDEMAGFFTHMFWIDEVTQTLYLADMFDQQIAIRIFTTGYEFTPVEYIQEQDIIVVRAGDYSVITGEKSGEEISVAPYHTGEAEITQALNDIITVSNKQRTRVPVPVTANIFQPTERLQLLDDAWAGSQNPPITTSTRARIIQYDFDNEIVVVEGEGIISI